MYNCITLPNYFTALTGRTCNCFLPTCRCPLSFMWDQGWLLGFVARLWLLGEGPTQLTSRCVSDRFPRHKEFTCPIVLPSGFGFRTSRNGVFTIPFNIWDEERFWECLYPELLMLLNNKEDKTISHSSLDKRFKYLSLSCKSISSSKS